MEFIKANLGANKVTLPINSNEFEETHSYVEEKDMFDKIEDLLSKFKELKKKSKNNKCFNGIDSIISCILESLDNHFTLLSFESMNDKIVNFKNKMKDVKAEDHLLFISKLINKTLVLKVSETDFSIYGKYEKCIVLEVKQNNTYSILQDDVDYNTMISSIVDARIKAYLDDNILEKLNKFLVKDLQEVAHKLYLPIHNKQTKKLFVKKELKEVIIDKLEAYKQ